MQPKPGEFWIPKFMRDLKTSYLSRTGNCRVFAQVFAIGNGELERKVMHGCGVIPAGGNDVRPVANISTFSSDTSLCFSRIKKKKHATDFCNSHKTEHLFVTMTHLHSRRDSLTKSKVSWILSASGYYLLG